jgi:hypothetical protein
LWEYSTLTGWGSNERTPLLSIKSSDNVNDGIEWLNVMLKKGNYTDERFIEIEKQLRLLKTLVIEPSKDTQIIEPKKTNNIVDAIKLFNALN